MQKKCCLFSGEMKMDVNMKTCMSADQCVSGSMNFGFTRTLLSSTCCSTDLCNVLYSKRKYMVSAVGSKPPNSKMFIYGKMRSSGVRRF